MHIPSIIFTSVIHFLQFSKILQYMSMRPKKLKTIQFYFVLCISFCVELLFLLFYCLKSVAFSKQSWKKTNAALEKKKESGNYTSKDYYRSIYFFKSIMFLTTGYSIMFSVMTVWNEADISNNYDWALLLESSSILLLVIAIVICYIWV